MSNVAKELNEANVEYKQGVIGWNKARIKRLLEDERYIGSKGFPSIVGKDIFNEIQNVIAERNIHQKSDKISSRFAINILFLCPICHGIMNRKRDQRYKKATKWHCENKNCRFMVAMEDEEMLERLTKMLERIAEDLESIGLSEPEEDMEQNLSYDLCRQGNFDKANFRNNILEIASQIYSELDNSKSKTKRLYDLFQNVKITDKFPKELFEKVVTEIGFESDGTLWLRLINGMKINEEQECLMMNQLVQ